MHARARALLAALALSPALAGCLEAPAEGHALARGGAGFWALDAAMVRPLPGGAEYVFLGQAGGEAAKPGAGPAAHAFAVPAGSRRVAAALAWEDPLADLDLGLRDGRGRARCGAAGVQPAEPPGEACTAWVVQGSAGPAVWSAAVEAPRAAQPAAYALRVQVQLAPLDLRGPGLPEGAGGGPGALRFRAPVLADGVHASGEPSVRVAPDGTLWVCAPSILGSAQASWLWRSDDDGRSFAFVPLDLPAGRDNPTGGGDCDLSLDAAGAVAVTDLWLGSTAMYASDDGAAWDAVPIAGAVPLVDRPWLLGGAPGEVWLVAQSIDTGAWVLRSRDGGRTFVEHALAAPRYLDGHRAGIAGGLAAGPRGELLLPYPVYVDPAAYWAGQPGLCGTLGVPCAAAEEVWLARSEDGGATWQRFRVAAGRNDTFLRLPVAAADRAGNVLVAWAEAEAGPGGNETHVWLAASSDGGASWGPPRRVSGAVPGHHVMPWLAAGGEGHAVLAWYGSPAPGHTWRSHPEGEWYVYVAQVADAHRPGATPRLGLAQDEPVLLGALERKLLDFVQVALTPDGRAVVAYADALHGPAPLVRVAVQEGGPRAPPLQPGERAPADDAARAGPGLAEDPDDPRGHLPVG